MECLVEQVLHPYYSFGLFIAFLLCITYVISVVKAIVSPLSRIPGPWYAPLTTLHLNYAFATGKIWKIVEDGHQKYGPIMRLGPRQVWISDKDAMKTILMTVDLPKVTMYAEISRDRSSPGLFGEIRHDPHKRLKRFLSPAFTVAYVDNLEPLFAECLKSLILKYSDALSSPTLAYSKKPTTTDLMDDLHSLALDIMGECSFGKGFGHTNPQKEVALGVDEEIWSNIPSAIFKGMARRYQMVYLKRFFRAIGVNIKFDWPDGMIAAIKAIINERTTNCEKSRPDLLQHLIEEGEKPDNGMKMMPRDVVDQMSEILLAGSETTSGTIACFFLEVLRNPQVKEKLMESLPVLRPDNSIITSKAVRNESQYEYLEACIKETLRLHPIASEMGRRTTNQAVELMGHVLPPHTVVCASYRDLHRNPAYWPDALRFWPERWLQTRPPDVPAPTMTAYYPFSAGKHSCIGKNFAWAEIRMVTANLLSRYDFVEVPEQNIDYRQYITMQFADGSWKAFLKPRYETKPEHFAVLDL